MNKITATDAQDMVTHWLATPVNGYLGSSYGSNVPEQLQKPMRTAGWDAVVRKVKNDVPLLGALPSNAVNIYAIDKGPDKRFYYFDISGSQVALGSKA